MIKGTELKTEDIERICYQIADGQKLYILAKEFSIGMPRILNISNKYQKRIDEIKREIVLKCEKEFVSKAIMKREKILDSIDESTIKASKLSARANAVNELTNCKRLEMGQSTSNIDLISKNASDEDLIRYVVDGILPNVNDANIKNGDNCKQSNDIVVSESIECKQ